MKTAFLTSALLCALVCAPASAELRRNIPYREVAGVKLLLDANVPEGKGPFPTAILVHGGSWRAGDKQMYITPLFDPLTKAGFTWFTIDYRLAPAYRYPAPVDDVVAAVQFVKAHAKEYKVDLKRIALVGESAGGHLVALVGARDGKKLGLAAVAPFYPPCNFEVFMARFKGPVPPGNAIGDLLGIKEMNGEAMKVVREASPVTYVSKAMPPFLLIHGTGDKLVPFSQPQEMAERMKAAGAKCELYAVEGAPHGVGGWEKNPEWQGYKTKLVEWLKQTMRVR